MRKAKAWFNCIVAVLLLTASMAGANGYVFDGDLAVPVEGWPFLFMAFDAQGDGGNDLFIAEADQYNFFFVLDRQDSTFTDETYYNYSEHDNHYIYSAQHGDINGDGYEDILAGYDSDSLDNIIMIWLNNGNGTFTADTSYAISSSPNAILYQDFDGDTYKDIMVCGYDVVSLFIGTGDGKFAAATTFSGGYGWHYSMAAADVDNDMDFDLIVDLSDRDSMYVKFNDGSGNFDSTVAYAAGDRPNWTCAGYLNADAYIDFVAGNRNSNTLSVYINNGDGSFAPAVSYTNTYPLTFTSLADLDGDDRPEILTVSRNSHKYFIFPNNGDGTFGTREDNYFYYPTEIMGHDFNGDGNTDLMIGTIEDYVSIKHGDGSGTFTNGMTKVATGRRVFDIASNELNGNATNDIAVVCYNNNTVQIYANYGDSTFGDGGTLTTGTGPYSIIIDDFDQTLGNDIAVTNSGTDNISVFFNDGSGNFSAGALYAVGDQPNDLVSGLFNNDAYPDLAVTNIGVRSVSILLNDGDGTFTLQANYIVGERPTGISGGDVNGDTYIDLVTTDFDDNTCSVLLGNGDGTFQPSTSFDVTEYPIDLALADFDGDTDLDIVMVHDGYPNVTFWPNNGDGTFTDTVETGWNSRSILRMAAADIDLDGDIDLAFGGQSAYFVNTLSNRGDGTMEYPVSYGMAHYSPAVCLADLNGDFYPELITATSHFSDPNPDTLCIFWNKKETIPLGTDDEPTTIPLNFELNQNYPNPFNPATTIDYSLLRQSHVTIEVFNILGQQIRTLVDADITAGEHSVVWDGADEAGKAVASGIYFYRMQTEEYSGTRKRLLIK